MENKIAYMKSCLTSQGFVAGADIALLFNIDHATFHDKMYNYYNSLNGNYTNQPTMYRKEITKTNGTYLPVSTSFPYDFNLMRADLGNPTYGFTSKNLIDLYNVFNEKSEEIEILTQTLMTIIKVDRSTIKKAYSEAKQCVINNEDYILDFENLPEISIDEAKELFGKLLIQDGCRSVKYRNLSAKNFQILAEGIDKAFIEKHPNGINRGGVTETCPVIEDDDKILWREIK